jgi:hypothetical protein
MVEKMHGDEEFLCQQILEFLDKCDEAIFE